MEDIVFSMLPVASGRPQRGAGLSVRGVRPTGVSCASATFCVAVTSTDGVLTFDGTDWSAITSLAPGVYLNGVGLPTIHIRPAYANRWSVAMKTNRRSRLISAVVAALPVEWNGNMDD